MNNEEMINQTYRHGNLLDAIEQALRTSGKEPRQVSINDLAPVDEFHIGGRAATERFIGQLEFPAGSHLLDIGCGLGGAARFVADQYQHRVSGIDLNPEYIETGNELCEWVGLGERISLRQGSAYSLPWSDSHFDGAFMLHVGMNIDNKELLFAELYRVLRPQARLGIYDVMREREGELAYPVPWATRPDTSFLASPEDYRDALEKVGFKVLDICNRRDFALEFFQRLKEKSAGKQPPTLGLHTLMQKTTAEKVNNMIANIERNLVAPVELIIEKG